MKGYCTMTDMLFTSESVSEGHPDKIADQISDAVLDAVIKDDPHSRVACETLVKSGMILVAGEITTNAWADIEQLARDVVRNIGYTNPHYGFEAESCVVLNAIGRQSPDIALGVDQRSDKKLGAGDQGLMFGYASHETDVLMPAPIIYAHPLLKRHAKLRKEKILSWLRPDAKSQITFHYKDRIPVAIDCVVLSTQHDPDVSLADIREAVIEEIIKPVLPTKWITPQTKYLINPTGRFVLCGPEAGCGLNRTKIISEPYMDV